MLADLSIGLQEIIWYNYDVFVRCAILFLMVIFSFSYLFYFKPNQKKTVEYREAFSRMIMNAISYAIMWTIPLYLVFFLNPETTYDLLFKPFFNIYYLIVIGYVLGFIIDLLRYGVPAMLIKVGMDFNDPKARKIAKRWFGGKLE